MLQWNCRGDSKTVPKLQFPARPSTKSTWDSTEESFFAKHTTRTKIRSPNRKGILRIFDL